MLNTIFTKVFGSRNERLVKKMGRSVQQINELEPGLQALSDEELAAKTDEFRKRLADGASLDDLLPKHSPVCVKPASGRWGYAISMFK